MLIICLGENLAKLYESLLNAKSSAAISVKSKLPSNTAFKKHESIDPNYDLTLTNSSMVNMDINHEYDEKQNLSMCI